MVYGVTDMDCTESILLRSRAGVLLDSAWENRAKLWRQEPAYLPDFLREAPEKIAIGLLGLKVLQVPEIPDESVLWGRAAGPEILGLMNRERREILVAQGFGFVRGRFTLAHEIAHWVLHPGLILHRERGSGGPPQTREEREANVFGAELLMPSGRVRDEFKARFGGVVNGVFRDEAAPYWLSSRDGRISHEQFLVDSRYRAVLFARTRQYHGRRIISMSEAFTVSADAMAIQLDELGLVR